jgi:hypothetical protein
MYYPDKSNPSFYHNEFIAFNVNRVTRDSYSIEVFSKLNIETEEYTKK